MRAAPIVTLLFSAPLVTAHFYHPRSLNNSTYASVERSLTELISNRTLTPRPLPVSSFPVPDSAAAVATESFIRGVHSGPLIYNHNRRSYIYACALLDPSLGLFPASILAQGEAEGIRETLWHATLLHDLGVEPVYNNGTGMSFEMISAVEARDFLRQPNVSSLPDAPSRWQRDDISESILVHTDMLLPGKATLLARVMHLGILADATGAPDDVLRGLWHEDTLKDALREWPRTGLKSALKAFLSTEVEKPGAHMSIVERTAPERFRAFDNPLLEPLMKEIGQPI